MSIFIDSASTGEIKEAMKLGYVSGVTTNPLLMARRDAPWRDLLKNICELSAGPVYYQIDCFNCENPADVVKSIHQISPKQVIVKIPAVHPYFKMAAVNSGKIWARTHSLKKRIRISKKHVKNGAIMDCIQQLFHRFCDLF